MIGVFDIIRAPNVPIVYPRFVFATRVEFDAVPNVSSHTGQITVQDPAGAVLAQTGGPFQLNGAQAWQTRTFFDSHMVLDSFVLQQFGQYTFSLAIDGILVGAAQLNVVNAQVG
jgi:hypothetical protein